MENGCFKVGCFKAGKVTKRIWNSPLLFGGVFGVCRLVGYAP